MTKHLTLLLFIGLAWGQAKNVSDSNSENQVTSKNSDNNSFFSDVSFSIRYSRFKNPDFHLITPIYPSNYKDPYSYGFSFIKPYKNFSIELGLGSLKSNEKYQFGGYWTAINPEFFIKYISFSIYKDYSASFLNFSIFNETRRYAAISIGFGANIYFDKNIENKEIEQYYNDFNELKWAATQTTSNPSNMKYLNHQIKGSVGLNVPLHDYVNIKISGKISNVIYPDFIHQRRPGEFFGIDTSASDWLSTEFKRFNKFLLNEMKLNQSVQFELIFNLFGTQNKRTKIIKRKRKKVPKGFEDF